MLSSFACDFPSHVLLFPPAVLLQNWVLPSKNSYFLKAGLRLTGPQQWHVAYPEHAKQCTLPKQPLPGCGTCLRVPFLLPGPTWLFLWFPPLITLWSPPRSMLSTLYVLVSCFSCPPPTTWSYQLLTLQWVLVILVLLASLSAQSSILTAASSYPGCPSCALWCSFLYVFAWALVWLCWLFLLLDPCVGPTRPLPTLSRVVRLYRTILLLHLLVSSSPPFGVQLLLSSALRPQEDSWG